MRILLLLLLAFPALAQSVPRPPDSELLRPGRRDGFVVDAERGCWLWVSGMPDGAAGLSARWSGPCPNGPAEGTGRSVFTWQEGGQERAMIYDGALRGGKSEGRGALANLRNGEPTVVESGDYADDHLVQGRVELSGQAVVYEGALREGRPHGRGALRTRRGAFEGEWQMGCLALPGGAFVAFMRNAEGCRSQES
jgi:hypothetical protein